jgi:protease-4
VKKVWQLITALKNAIGNLLFIAFIVLVIVALVGHESESIPASAVMIVDPEGVIVEQLRSIEPIEEFLRGGEPENAETLGRDLVDAIQLAETDDRIKAIALDLSRLQGTTLNQYDDIGNALDSFKASGKPVFAYGARFTQSQYYLASFADTIYIDKESLPVMGGVFLQGFGAYPLYLKSALDKLQVSMHVLKAGIYKGAAETFLRDDMSDEYRESTQEVIDFLWDSYLSKITLHRNISAEEIINYIDNYATLLDQTENGPAQLALELGLIDGLVTSTEWRAEMQAISGESGDTFEHVVYRSYLQSMRPPIPVQNPDTDKIAVIIAKGTILDGEQPAGEVGGDTIAKLIRKARNSKNVKAVVLRVDSPGGSAAASELIRIELAATQESGKPVVASMGGYAASGGYWISSTANKIFASETTITGSIGVFTIFPTFERSLDYLGVHSDGIGTTSLSGAMNNFEKIKPVFKRMLQNSVNQTYNKFLALVSEGRGLSFEEADSVAQGRVWSGSQALEHGLIDGIGDVNVAIESAAALAGLTDYGVVYMQKELSPREQFLRQVLQSAVSILPAVQTGLFPAIPAELKTLTQMVRSPSIYLQCTNCKSTF